jgi:UDP:flavonoid glycosyltransferase YjiC (YdhE family)
MKLGLQTWGSEGDVRPFLALAGGLAQAGHDVTLLVTEVAARDYSQAALAGGFRLMEVASPVFSDADEMRQMEAQLLTAGNPLAQSKLIVSRAFDPVAPAMFEAARQLCSESDLVIGHYFVHPLRAAADAANKPYVTVQLTHGFVPSRFTKPDGFPELGRWSYPFAWKLGRWLTNRLLLPRINAVCKQAKVSPVRDVICESWVSPLLNLIAVSPTLCERQLDWSANHAICGFFELPAEAMAPSGDVEEFLIRGAPPVYFTFGSLTPWEPRSILETAQLWIDAANIVGCRAILQLPAATDLPSLPSEQFLVMARCNHNEIFPRCAAVVHHGGAGTTHSVLRAGIPSVVVPHVADQTFWADVLRRRRLGVAAEHRRKITAPTLAKAIGQAISSPDLRANTAAAARAMRNENGVAQAVALIGSLLKQQ